MNFLQFWFIWFIVLFCHLVAKCGKRRLRRAGRKTLLAFLPVDSLHLKSARLMIFCILLFSTVSTKKWENNHYKLLIQFHLLPEFQLLNCDIIYNKLYAELHQPSKIRSGSSTLASLTLLHLRLLNFKCSDDFLCASITNQRLSWNNRSLAVTLLLVLS